MKKFSVWVALQKLNEATNEIQLTESFDVSCDICVHDGTSAWRKCKTCTVNAAYEQCKKKFDMEINTERSA